MQSNKEIVLSPKTRLRKVVMRHVAGSMHLNQTAKKLQEKSKIASTTATPGTHSARGSCTSIATQIDPTISRNQSIKFKHWSQVVSTSYGYELFINHLEKEFSVENLLFITEVR